MGKWKRQFRKKDKSVSQIVIGTIKCLELLAQDSAQNDGVPCLQYPTKIGKTKDSPSDDSKDQVFTPYLESRI